MVKLFDTVWHKWLGRPYKLAKTVEAGEGDRIILALHGLGTNGYTWEPLVRQLNKKKWRIIGYDLLGFGQSPKPNHSSYDVNAHAASVLASLDHSIKRKKIVIIGHSMGCLVATHIAWLRPDMVQQLILFEPPLFADSPEFRSHKRRRQLYFTLYEQILQWPKILFTYSKLAARFAAGRTLTLDSSSWLAFERSLKNTIIKQQAYDELKNISVPTDIIYGKFDFVVTRSDVKKMLKANEFITFHLVNEVHDVSTRAARFIIKLLN